ncbi:hypothetical protein F4782DRAFT_502430 [Xylaria castorea]|nr:hypothetical protein F4782DRAFT_502430 [Xylaria castorea]
MEMAGDFRACATTWSLESLPLLILEDICDYLALGRNEDGKDEGSIGAFSLVSRSCYRAAAAQRFGRIRLAFSGHTVLRDVLKTWDEILRMGNHFRHVRQLILMYAEENGKPRTVNHNDARGYFDVDDSLKPAGITLSKRWLAAAQGEDAKKNWQVLSQLISRMPGLKDFVYALGDHLDPCILAAIHAVGCRLHMHCFSLQSFYQPKDRPSDINPDDYALATSPCLHAIVVSHAQFNRDGFVDYHREATLRMVAGAAPNLAHVWLRTRHMSGTLAFQRAIRGPRPPWRGFFPSKEKEDDASMGSLKSLMLHNGLERRENMVTWSHITDLSRLRCLAMSFEMYTPRSYTATGESLDTLVELAETGQLASLRSFSLDYCGDPELGNYSELLIPITRFLNSVGLLQNLHVPHVDPMRLEALFAAMSRHTLSPCCQLLYGTQGS